MTFKKADRSRSLADLQQLWDMPLEKKVVMTKQRIRQWVEHYGLKNVYVSFSGGKDSTVLLHIAREMYPDIKAVFVDTTLEFPEVRTFALSHDNIDVIKPTMNFRETVVQYGYPIFSKEICETVNGARRWLTALRDKYDNPTDRQHCLDQSTHSKFTACVEPMIFGTGTGSIATTESIPSGVDKASLIEQNPTNERTNERTNEDGVFIRVHEDAWNKSDTMPSAELARKIYGAHWTPASREKGLRAGVVDAGPTELYFMIRSGDIPEPIRSQILDGTFKNPNPTKSVFNKMKWQFMLFAPFDVSNKCCSIMKKGPAHRYNKETGRYAITAEMASESKLRSQQWMNNGCNGFDMKTPKSTPMAFWLEQDVLTYIKANNIEIPSVYGDIVASYGDSVDGQMNIADYAELGALEIDNVQLHTTWLNRTGCIACGFGIHLEKPSCHRLYAIEQLSNPKILDWILRGGAFDENGLWKPDNRGLGFWFVYEWVNQNGGLRNVLDFPHREEYIQKYNTELTEEYLHGGKKYFTH